MGMVLGPPGTFTRRTHLAGGYDAPGRIALGIAAASAGGDAQLYGDVASGFSIAREQTVESGDGRRSPGSMDQGKGRGRVRPGHSGPHRKRREHRARLDSQVDQSGWTRCSAGDGAKGPRIYDWATVEIRPLREPGKGYWLLVRRSIIKPEELAYYFCYGPAGTTLEELARVAGIRWAIEESFEEAKGQVGLDQYEVRRWDGWYQHITLAMLAQAYLSVIKHQALERREKGATTVRMKN